MPEGEYIFMHILIFWMNYYFNVMSLLFLEGTKMYNINNLTQNCDYLQSSWLELELQFSAIYIQKLMNTSHDNYYVDFLHPGASYFH